MAAGFQETKRNIGEGSAIFFALFFCQVMKRRSQRDVVNFPKVPFSNPLIHDVAI